MKTMKIHCKVVSRDPGFRGITTVWRMNEKGVAAAEIQGRDQESSSKDRSK